MPRTAIPGHLIHRPEEVERNAERFDQLCRLAEEVAFPVVREALIRETVATGADVLASEAQLALETLAEGAAILEGLDEQHILDDVKRNLNEAIPPPEDEECHAHTRDVVQVLVSTWLEILRHYLEGTEAVVLHSLLPQVASGMVTRVIGHLWAAKPSVRPLFTEALASFAIEDNDIDVIMVTLSTKLFAEPRVVELPFSLVIIGAPEMPVVAMNRSTYERFLDDVEKKPIPAATRKRAAVLEPAIAAFSTPAFVTPHARYAVTLLCEPLSPMQYASLTEVASPQFTMVNLANRGLQALAATIRRS